MSSSWYVDCIPVLSPTNACLQVLQENSLATMLAANRSAGVAPEVNLREHVTHLPLSSANRAAHSGFGCGPTKRT